MSIPFNRIVAFAGPYISLLAGGAATWIIAKANALGIDGLEQSDLAQQLASAASFTLAAGLTWLGQAQWLKGHHQQILGDASVQAAALAVPLPPQIPPPPDPAHDALMALGEDLPADDEEFALPPDDGARIVPDIPPAPAAPSVAAGAWPPELTGVSSAAPAPELRPQAAVPTAGFVAQQPAPTDFPT